jgi:hypothetical protein
MSREEAARGGRVVVVYQDASAHRAAHDHATTEAIARMLADIKRMPFAGEYDADAKYATTPYFVPTDTLIGVDHARSLGIESEDDLFGGIVRYPFVATKSISHPLVDERARAPEGWSQAFAGDVVSVVLRGYTAFDLDDAHRAGLELLRTGRVRIKRALGIGGRGQDIVRDRKELEAALENVDGDEVWRYGVALEDDLDDVSTYSVGCAHVDEISLAYHGMQRTTRNPRGGDVYGGSDLVIVRGDFDTLAELDVPEDAAHALAQARTYDDAALRHFDGLIASRRNYDVVSGNDAAGRLRFGVLEQSWRVGGASGAEVAALRAFREDATLHVVRASCVEAYGDVTPPDDALVYYCGDDSHGGMLTKYARVERVHDASASALTIRS